MNSFHSLPAKPTAQGRPLSNVQTFPTGKTSGLSSVFLRNIHFRCSGNTRRFLEFKPVIGVSHCGTESPLGVFLAVCQDPSRILGRHGHIEDGCVRGSLEGFYLGSIQRPLNFHSRLSGLPCPAVTRYLKCTSPVNNTERPRSRTVQDLNRTCPVARFR